MLSINTLAPDFSLIDKDGSSHKLSDYLGKKVILYFYPKDNTSGCTKQALNYKDLFNDIIDKNAVIIGISKDSKKSHMNFVSKYDLLFILLSDENLEAIKAYDVWHEKKLYGRTYMGVVRTTYIIDEKGYIISAEENVKPDDDAKNSLCILNK